MSKERILKNLKKPMTANQLIDKLFEKDVSEGVALNRGWRYYVHLNKLFAPMRRDGLIKQIGVSVGVFNEKIWTRIE